MLCFREQLLVFESIDFSTESPTGLMGCDLEVSFRGKLHGKSNLCVLIAGNWKWQVCNCAAASLLNLCLGDNNVELEHPANILYDVPILVFILVNVCATKIHPPNVFSFFLL